jgi:hypothetical protein
MGDNHIILLLYSWKPDRTQLIKILLNKWIETININEIDDVCLLCLDNFEIKTEIIKIKNCNHIYHISCYNKLIKYNYDKCPACRQLIIDIKKLVLNN